MSAYRTADWQTEVSQLAEALCHYAGKGWRVRGLQGGSILLSIEKLTAEGVLTFIVFDDDKRLERIIKSRRWSAARELADRFDRFMGREDKLHPPPGSVCAGAGSEVA